MMVNFFHKETIEKYTLHKYTSDKSRTFLNAEIIMTIMLAVLIVVLPFNMALKALCLLPYVVLAILEFWLIISRTDCNRKKYLKRRLSELVFFHQMLWIIDATLILALINWGDIDNSVYKFCLYTLFFCVLYTVSVVLFHIIQNKTVMSPVLKKIVGKLTAFR